MGAVHNSIWLLSGIHSSSSCGSDKSYPLHRNTTGRNILGNQAIQKVPPHDIYRGFYSGYFVPKKDTTTYCILYLWLLNTYIWSRCFRMVTLESIIPLLKRKDWFVVTDLKDAYFHISIHPCYQKYLRFFFVDTPYQLCALPFRLSKAPRTFTKCIAPIAAYFRLHNIVIFPYIDDWLIVAPSHHKALQDTPDLDSPWSRNQQRQILPTTNPSHRLYRGTSGLHQSKGLSAIRKYQKDKESRKSP